MPAKRRVARPDDDREERPAELTATTASQAGLRHIVDLTAREAESVTLVEPVEDGWVVEVEVIEDRRIPSSGDILALYEADLDTEGNLLSYRRKGRYRRGTGDMPRER
ncbi:gas vesicle protein GvpO [Nonomuraea sp. NPDC059194]|uniref:gas vesicle protein GvpO n=1 Tax=Nonomuraea sp. NPDC059194 TaxID=3346764 RepID=UPI0036AD4AD0